MIIRPDSIAWETTEAFLTVPLPLLHRLRDAVCEADVDSTRQMLELCSAYAPVEPIARALIWTLVVYSRDCNSGIGADRLCFLGVLCGPEAPEAILRAGRWAVTRMEAIASPSLPVFEHIDRVWVWVSLESRDRPWVARALTDLWREANTSLSSEAA